MPKACPYKSVKALLWSDIVFSCTKFRLDPKMRKFAFFGFLTTVFFEVSAQRGRIDDNYGARENEWMIPLIILIILACLFIYAWIAGQIKKK